MANITKITNGFLFNSSFNDLIKKYNLDEVIKTEAFEVPKSSSIDFTKLQINGEQLCFPNVWLRENCQCSSCFHASARSRIVEWEGFNVEVRPREVREAEGEVEITWDDHHQSRYTHQWLALRAFTPQHQNIYTDTIYKPQKNTWHGKDFQDICSRHDYTKVLNSDQALYNFLEKLSIYGVAVIENTPHEETATNQIIAKIGFPKQTHYGVQYIVRNVPNTINVAYLSSKLPLHVDLPYYEYCPGVNMLHCLVQTTSQGGENLLCDVHYTAEYMKTHHPREYQLLTDVEVEWSDVGSEAGLDFYKLHRAPVICLNKQQQITRINFSIPQRGSHFPANIDLVKPWYKAHDLFLKLNKEFAAKFKTQVEEILVFDNSRMLHGRNKYEDCSNNVRQLIGTFVDWDEVYSRLRCLRVKLNPIKGL